MAGNKTLTTKSQIRFRVCTFQSYKGKWSKETQKMFIRIMKLQRWWNFGLDSTISATPSLHQQPSFISYVFQDTYAQTSYVTLQLLTKISKIMYAGAQALKGAILPKTGGWIKRFFWSLFWSMMSCCLLWKCQYMFQFQNQCMYAFANMRQILTCYFYVNCSLKKEASESSHWESSNVLDQSRRVREKLHLDVCSQLTD